MRKVMVFLGKGGVGKTTCAASTALALAEAGHRVLAASLDPAHNLGDVLDVGLEDRPQEIAPRLCAMEVDVEGRIQRYLQQAADRFQGVYRYLRVFEADGERLALPARPDEDPVLRELHAARGETKALEALLSDRSRTCVAVVMNPERLPLLETLRTLQALGRFGIPAGAVIVNKVSAAPAIPDGDPANAAQEIQVLARLRQEVGLPILEAGLVPGEVRGLDQLRRFACPAARHFARWVSQERRA